MPTWISLEESISMSYLMCKQTTEVQWLFDDASYKSPPLYGKAQELLIERIIRHGFINATNETKIKLGEHH